MGGRKLAFLLCHPAREPSWELLKGVLDKQFVQRVRCN